MAPMKWFLVTALAIVTFSDARLHIKHIKYKIKPNEKKPQAEELLYTVDDDGLCGNINVTRGDREMLHQRKKLPHTLPFVVYVVKRHRYNYQPVCVATILPDADDESSSIVLTLTTCIEAPEQLDVYKVYTGKRLPALLNKTNKLYDIEEVLIDKNSPNLRYANAMVMRLSRSIPIAGRFQPICLPKPNAELPKHSSCILSVVRTDGSQQPYMVEVEPKSTKECRKMHGEDVQIDKKMEICGLDYRDGAFIEEKNVAQKFIDDSGIECGRTKFSAKQAYELGQKKMYPYRFPWAGTLARTVGQNHIPECMVTLIPDADEDGSKIVLTLSSCIQDYRLLKHYKVYFGKRFPIPTRSRHLYSIESITLDKKTPNMAIGNAAVLTLTRAVPINNTFQAACLSKLAAPMPEDSHCVLTLLRGDGKNGQPEHYLVDTTTKSNQYCKRIPGQSFIIDSNMEVCATDRRDGFFLATGGALLCLFQDQWVQYGVYSHSSHIVDDLNYVYNSTMNGKESPAAYINVSKFRLLMQNSQNLNTLGRLNLMRLR
ncbi:Trypsin domain containing protein [Trichuris trichiura]|uniref:Trypsin domain containing protein n=1 Tax=Trichuris trichiura TaxID=36087 RepID=A0A077YWT0_TRITR|nr:Trypsin domain containing protein [Trichuris trichiura]